MASTKDTRNDILRTAEDLVQKKGFAAFSYRDLGEVLQLKNASIHYHFPTKEDLGLAMLDDYRARFAAWISRTDENCLSATDMIRAYVAMFKKLLGKSERICPGGAFGADFNLLSDPLRKGLAALQSDQHAWLTSVIEAGQQNSEFRKDDANAMASLVQATMQGAVQLARAQKSPRFLDSMEEQILEYLMK